MSKLMLPCLCLALMACTPTPTEPGPSGPPRPSASVSSNPSSNPSTGPSSNPGSTSGSFVYLGLNADKVMSGAMVKADGVNDLHFSYTHNFASESEVESIRIVRLDNGIPNNGIGWSTVTGNLWILGIEANGNTVNQTYLSPVGKFNGSVKFDFYGSQSGVESYGIATPGTAYQLEIKLSGETEAIKLQATL